MSSCAGLAAESVWFRLVFCILSMIYFSIAPAVAEPLDETPVRLTAALPAFPPFAEKSATGELQGAVVEVYRRLSEASGIQFDIGLYPYARTIRMLDQAQLDSAIIFRNDALRDKVDLIGPISFSKVMVYCQKDTAMARYEDLYQVKRIAVIPQASFGEPFDSDAQLNKERASSYLQGLKMMQLGRVDCIVGSEEGLIASARELHFDLKRSATGWQMGTRDWCLHIPRGRLSASIRQRLQAAVSKIQSQWLIEDLVRAQDANGGLSTQGSQAESQTGKE